MRDVALAAKFKWGLKGSDLINMLDRAESSYKDMIENKAFGNDWCLHQKYETVFYDNHKAVEQIAEFLGVHPNEEIIKEVIEQCSINNMLKISQSKTLTLKGIILLNLGRVALIIKKFLPPPFNKSWKLRKYYLWLLPNSRQCRYKSLCK